MKCVLVTDLSRVHDAITAPEANRAFASSGWADIVGFDFADAAAAVTSQSIAVVALFAGLVHNAVATARWGLPDATRGWIRHVAVDCSAGTAGA
jgi:hypothetical protein